MNLFSIKVSSLKILTICLLSSGFSITYGKEKTQSGLTRAEHLNHRGELYHFGLKGQKKDYEKARLFYLQAVKEGSAVAANHLGRLYLNGEGVAKNYTIADEWYKRSAQLDPSIENKAINDQLANKELRTLVLSAMKRNAKAQYELAEILENGSAEMPKDLQKAIHYYQLAGKQKEPRALQRLKALRKED